MRAVAGKGEAYLCNKSPFWHWTSQPKQNDYAPSLFTANTKMSVRKIAWFDQEKPWVVIDRRGVVTSNHRRFRQALNKAVDDTRARV